MLMAPVQLPTVALTTLAGTAFIGVCVLFALLDSNGAGIGGVKSSVVRHSSMRSMCASAITAQSRRCLSAFPGNTLLCNIL